MRLLQLLRLAVILRLSLALLEPPIRIKPRYVAPRASLTPAARARLNHLQGHVAPTPGDVAVLPSHLRETELRARGGTHFNVTLVGDTWVADLGVGELTELWLREVRPPAISRAAASCSCRRAWTPRWRRTSRRRTCCASPTPR